MKCLRVKENPYFHRWKSGEPSSFSNNRKEDCVAILADPDWGKWSDESCVMETPFACKTRGKTVKVVSFLQRICLQSSVGD